MYVGITTIDMLKAEELLHVLLWVAELYLIESFGSDLERWSRAKDIRRANDGRKVLRLGSRSVIVSLLVLLSKGFLRFDGELMLYPCELPLLLLPLCTVLAFGALVRLR